jgi:hypothetical protein
MLTSYITHWDQTWAARHPKRITRPQKEAFLQTLEGELQARGYATQRITDRNWPQSCSLITTCAQPAVIFLAHYDTPTIMPGWLDGFTRLFGHTRQIPMALALIVALQLPAVLAATCVPKSRASWPSACTASRMVCLSGDPAWLEAMAIFIKTTPNPHKAEELKRLSWKFLLFVQGVRGLGTKNL